MLGGSEILWRSELPSELKFWDNYLREKDCVWGSDSFDFRMDPTAPLQPDLLKLVEKMSGSDLRILDVGAGPLTYLGKTSPQHRLEIVAVDPLAKDFDRLLNQYGVEPPIRTVSAHAEKLRAKFDENTFDLVYARNSLDHAYDLLTAVRQMAAVAKPGGLIVLEHYANEAQKMGYLGLHQWNFSMSNGQLCVDNQVVSEVVSVALQDVLQAESCEENERLITAVFRKKAQRAGVASAVSL